MTTTLNSTISSEKSKELETIYQGQQSFLIMVIGKSGRGKSYGIRTLDPEYTYMINAMGKPLPFPRGLRYKSGVNMFIGADSTRIRKVMKDVSKNPAIDTLIIDDAQYVMATEFMDKAMVKGFDKFTLMARNIWEILILATKLRAGLKVFFLTHEEDTGAERKMKTLGKLLDDKITPEGLSTIVLFADVSGSQSNRKYFLSTQSDGITNAKSPDGMFPTQVPNDYSLISARIDEYYAEIDLKHSKLKFNL